MDQWGPDECSKPERIDEVVKVMREEAAARGLPFLDAAGRFLVRRAIKNARKSHVDP
jgi:heterodisulfide reductase subunit C